LAKVCRLIWEKFSVEVQDQIIREFELGVFKEKKPEKIAYQTVVPIGRRRLRLPRAMITSAGVLCVRAELH